MQELTMSKEDTIQDEELERLAEQRIEIEEKLDERSSELAKIGEISQAYCVDFEKQTPSRNYANDLVFTFECPDGSTVKSLFHTEDVGEVESFLDEFGADSVTDMLGAERDVIYTDSGWMKTYKPHMKHSLYYHLKRSQGDLYRIFWPPLVVFPVVFLAGAMSGPRLSLLWAVLTVLLPTISVLKTAWYP